MQRIDVKIVKERNEQIREIEREISDLSEISLLLSSMLSEQGDQLEVNFQQLENIEEDFEQVEQSLEKSANYMNRMRAFTKDVAIMIGGISLGALGFFGGPLVGMATLISGITVSSGIVVASKKMKRKL